MRKQNIILFSSGVSEGNGILFAVRDAFEKLGYQCSYWRDLFRGANDPQNIALLPVLIKKIPTFDFAVLICEGHDKTQLVRGGKLEVVSTMRDNVVFEIGLCTMALGMNRVILLTDGQARLPEDLTGVHQETAVKVIEYRPEDRKTYERAAGEAAEYLNAVGRQEDMYSGITDMVRDADAFIRENQSVLAPTVIGASVSTASGYVSNFVLRTLEKCNEGFELDNSGKLTFFPDEKIFFHIVLPIRYSEQTPASAKNKMRQLRTGRVPSARFRAAEFQFRIIGDEMHIIDYPTTLATSYQTARLILGMEADENADPKAEERFNAKELDLFGHALTALFRESFIDSTVRHFYHDDTKEEEDRLISRLLGMVRRVSIEREDY